MKNYLIQYDREEHRLARCEEFVDGDVAYATYSALEREHLADDRYEIVLLGADSLDVLKVTHAHYFTPNGDLARLFANARRLG